MQSDPIGLRGGLNTYTYARATPLSSSDALGLVDVRLLIADRVAGVPPGRPGDQYGLPDMSVGVGVSVAGMAGLSGESKGTGFAVDVVNRRFCLYIEECTISGLGLCVSGGVNVGMQRGGLNAGTAQQAGYTIIGGRGPSADLQVVVDSSGGIGAVKGLVPQVGLGAGGGYVTCATGYRCWSF